MPRRIAHPLCTVQCTMQHVSVSQTVVAAAVASGCDDSDPTAGQNTPGMTAAAWQTCSSKMLSNTSLKAHFWATKVVLHEESAGCFVSLGLPAICAADNPHC